MRAGRLRHRVRILRKEVATDESGSHTEAWAEICQRWASVEGLRGREYFEAGQSRGEVDVRVVMRAGADVRVSDRIQHGTRLFDVQTPPIDSTGRRQGVEIMCKEYVS